MHKKTAHRWRLLVTLLVGTFFAFGSFWLLQVMEREEHAVDSDAFKNEPDYIIEKFSFVRMTPEGQPRYLFSGERLSHRPLDDSSDVDQPVLESIAPGKPPMTITARSARILHEQDQVELLGNVEIDRPPAPDARALNLKTEALTVFPDEDRMASNRRVEMKLGSATIIGTGMQANNATRQITMGSEGTIIYPPKALR